MKVERWRNKERRSRKQWDTDFNPTKSVAILNVSSLNTSLGIQRLLNWIKKQDRTRCCLCEPHFMYKDVDYLQVKKDEESYIVHILTKWNLE